LFLLWCPLPPIGWLPKRPYIGSGGEGAVDFTGIFRNHTPRDAEEVRIFISSAGWHAALMARLHVETDGVLLSYFCSPKRQMAMTMLELEASAR